MVAEQDVLMHYGILGMKWGVRRTPEQLGHKKAEAKEKRLQKYKDKKAASIEKKYDRLTSKAKKDVDKEPDNNELKERIKNLENSRRDDLEKTKTMTYDEMSSERKEKRDKITKAVIDNGLRLALLAGGLYLRDIYKYEALGAAWRNSLDLSEIFGR